MSETSDGIIVSIDYTHGKDEAVLIVGRSDVKGKIDIINAFQGQEAYDLYEKLITVKKKEGKT